MDLQRTLNNYVLILERADKANQAGFVTRELCKRDLFFLLYWVCGRKDLGRQWILDRAREVEGGPDGYLDLWARYHYKSSLITFGKTIQDILCDPEKTFGIFSFARPIAKPFLRQIKREFEENVRLKALFPDVLYQNPASESPKWSEDDGIIVKRKGNPPASTVEAWGLVEGQCTGKHFNVRIYDDIVTEDAVTTPEMIAKVTKAWEASLNLGVEGGKARYAGTRWHYNDTYREIMARGAAIPRIRAGTIDGTETGKPVLWSDEWMVQMRRDMGPFTFAAQVLLDPKAKETQGFKEEWFKIWPAQHYRGMNLYVLADPANSKRKGSDYSVFMVVGTGSDKNYYVVTMLRDRLNLTERCNVLFEFQRQYQPVRIGYEEYGMQADIQHYEDRMKRDNHRFSIVSLKGKMAKEDRIRKLIPLFEQGRIFFPESCVRRNCEGMQEDLVKIFKADEYLAFPFVAHDDMLDCLARIVDDSLMVSFPDYVPSIVGASDENTRAIIEQKQEVYNPLVWGLS